MGRSIKLLSITNRYYLISLLLFFIIAGVLLFFIISFNLDEELDEQLYTEQVHVVNAIRSVENFNELSMPLYDNFIVKKDFTKVNRKPQIVDSLMYDDVEKEMIPFRVIRFSAQTKNARYIILIKKSKIETVDLFFGIFLSLMIVFGLFCMILYVSNSYLNRKIWSPFLETIAAIKTLNINDRDVSFNYKHSKIEELNELNSSLQKMIEQIKSDFFRMKEFSENAAHELQTPLSIIRSKLESLLQSENLNNEDAQLIDRALESTVRLSKLNQSLLLLTKIENRQFEQKQLIPISSVIDKYLELYFDLIDGKKLSVTLNKEKEFFIDINPVLSDLLISNLLGNAIKHNVQNGDIVINIKHDGLEMSNSGEAPEYATDELFSRFKKGNHAPEHLGLGLALVKEIVETCGFNISYVYKNERHTLFFH